MIIKILGGIAGLGLTGWLASQSWVGAIILSVVLAAIVWAMLMVMRFERTRPAKRVNYSARPIPQMNPGNADTAIPAASRAGIVGPKSLHLHFHGVSDDQVADVVRELPR